MNDIRLFLHFWGKYSDWEILKMPIYRRRKAAEYVKEQLKILFNVKQ